MQSSDLKCQDAFEMYIKRFILVRRHAENLFCYQVDMWMTLAGSLLQHSTKGFFFQTLPQNDLFYFFLIEVFLL